MIWATIDPGLDGTGIAVWTNATLPVYVTSFSPKSKEEGWGRIVNVLQEYGVLLAHVEQPAYFESNKGLVSARSQALIKLCEYVGGIQAFLFQKSIKCSMIDVIAWKGTLPKEVVQRRILRVWPEAGEVCKSSHSFDAVGIGFFLKELINK